MAFVQKNSDNTPLEEIGTIPNPDAPRINANTKTLIDRYVFASNWCKGKTVLDCASGVGYGAHILRGLGANNIECLDIDEKTIITAREFYTDNNILFKVCDITKKISDEEINYGKFDVVVSMETFEHVKREDVPQMLENFKHLCKQGGKIIISTPKRHTKEFIYQGGTHLCEYSENEFINELMAFFDEVTLYYALEFRHPASNELNTVFTSNPQYSSNAVVMVAVINNV